MKNKILITCILLLTYGSTFACKCIVPGSVKEAFDKTSFIIHGKVIRYELVSFEETVQPKKAKSIKESLKTDTTALQLFESRFIAKVEIEVIQKFKGNYRKKTVIIYTPQSSASCGYSFEEGKEYIVYASPGTNSYSTFVPNSKRKAKVGKENTFWTNLCTRTAEYAKGEDQELRSLKDK